MPAHGKLCTEFDLVRFDDGTEWPCTIGSGEMGGSFGSIDRDPST
jgi:hypothetical protein